MGTAVEFLPCLTYDIGLAAAESLWCGVSANSGYTNIPFPVPSVQKIIFISGGGVAKTGSTPEVWIGMTRFGNILPISFNGTLSITFAEVVPATKNEMEIISSLKNSFHRKTI